MARVAIHDMQVDERLIFASKLNRETTNSEVDLHVLSGTSNVTQFCHELPRSSTSRSPN